MQDPLPIVMQFADRLRRERHGWRDTKALILLVARSGDWNGAAALCDAFGLDDRTIERLHREAYGYDQPPWSDHQPGRAPAPPTRRRA
jgi:hypothetical protein